jgi:hypothetical protein
MNCIFRVSRLIVFIIMLSVMTGCAMFAGGKVPGTTLAESTVEDQTKPTLSFHNSKINSYLTGDSYQELLRELRKSQYFKQINGVDSAEADIELEVTLKANRKGGSHPVQDWLSGLTLNIIPIWKNDHYEVTALVKNKKGLEKEYVVSDTITFVLWLPLWLVSPFTLGTEEDVLANMYRNIIQQMYEDGFIEEN